MRDDMSEAVRRYYYLCSYPLGSGSVIEPGNWWRILRRHPLNTCNPRVLIQELAFERVRAAEFPEKPTRAKANFLCETREDIKAFQGRSRRSFDIIYEVGLCDPSAPIHRGCLRCLDLEENATLDSLEQKARQYWSGDAIERPEVLTSSRIQIVGAI
jgi:hypothetical protein